MEFGLLGHSLKDERKNRELNGCKAKSRVVRQLFWGSGNMDLENEENLGVPSILYLKEFK